MTSDLMTGKQYATHRGVSEPMVSKYRKAGRLVLDDTGLIKVAESDAMLDATQDPSKETKNDKAAGKPKNEDGLRYQSARARREHWDAERAELEYRREAGELLVAGEVATIVAAAVTTLRSRLETLPDTLAPELAAMSDEQQIRIKLAEHVERTLDNLAQAFNGMARS